MVGGSKKNTSLYIRRADMLHKQAITIINLFQFNCSRLHAKAFAGLFESIFHFPTIVCDCCFAFHAWELNAYASHFYLAAKKNSKF